MLTRQDMQRAGAALESETPIHGTPVDIRTSGSTGTPVRVQGTAVTRTFVLARYLRNHLWHGRDFEGKAATIRNFPEGVAMPPEGETAHGWGIVYRSGPLARLNIRATVDEQLAWLERERPQYLWSLASNVRALVERAAALGMALPSLRQVSTFGESLDPRLREGCRQTWGVEIVDIYSSEEFGPIALQCPENPHYHVQSEGLRVEVLDEHGRPCPPGEVGRVVVTDLHNFATPSSATSWATTPRWGRPARAGAACPCWRACWAARATCCARATTCGGRRSPPATTCGSSPPCGSSRSCSGRSKTSKRDWPWSAPSGPRKRAASATPSCAISGCRPG